MTQPFEIPLDVSFDSLRRLARGLVLDSGLADDAVQEAWVAALRRQREGSLEVRGLGAWLGGTVKRLLRERLRSEARRTQRERAGARSELEPAAVEASARIEITRTLLEAVERLDDAYRAALVLRFFDDLPPREIARRLGLPVNTVRTHVRRGLERLRADLDRRVGRDRDALLSGLVPLLGLPGPGEGDPQILGGGEMAPVSHGITAAGLATGALVLALGSWLLLRPHGRAPASSRASSVATTAPAATVGPAGVVPGASTTPGVPAREIGASESGRASLQSDWIVCGRVQRGTAPFGGAALVGRLWAGPMAAGTLLLEQALTADERGDFAWALPPPTALVTVEVTCPFEAGFWNAASSWVVPGDPAPTHLLVGVEPFDCTVRGTVRALDGLPVSGARVSGRLGAADASVSATDGTYAFPWASTRRLQLVHAWMPGHAAAGTEGGALVPGGTLQRDLVLRPEILLGGRVLDEAGDPIAGATIAITQWIPTGAEESSQGHATVRSTLRKAFSGWPDVRADAAGQYRTGGIDPRADVDLVARAPGYLGAARSVTGLVADSEGIDLVLQRGTVVRGRVLADGEPVEWAWVSLGEPEGAMERDGPDPGTVQAWTDGEGRFTLAGVPPGAQVLWGWRHGHAQLRHELVVQTEGPEVELALAPGHFLGGVVRSADGAPVPWAGVTAEDAGSSLHPGLQGFFTWADSEGRFRFDDLPQRPVRLTAFAPGHADVRHEVQPLDRDDLVLTLTPAHPEPPPPALAPIPLVPVTAASGTGRVEGRLQDASGSGRVGQTVRLEALESTVGAVEWRVTTDAVGHFAFGALPAGTLRLAWERDAGGHRIVDLELPFVLAEGELRAQDLQPTGRVRVLGTVAFLQALPEGSVSMGDPLPLGDPPEGMPAVLPISIVPAKSGCVPWTRRGGFALDGSFELEALEPGTYRVETVVRLANGRETRGASFLRVPDQDTAEVVVRVLRPQ